MKEIFLAVTLLYTYLGQSQSYVGYLTDNYSGVHQVVNNPSNIVDSRFRADVNFFGFSVLASNDYYQASFNDILRATRDEVELQDVSKKTPLDKNNLIVNFDILGPSFMFNITPKHSVAFFTRARGLLNVRGVNGKSIELLGSDLTEDDAYSFREKNINFSTNMWTEFGVSYATILLNKQDHFLKGGLTVKYLQSAGSAYGYAKDIFVDYDPKGVEIKVPEQGGGTTLQKVPAFTAKGEVSYGYTQRFEDGFDNYNFELLGEEIGVGADLGFTYEWRPDFKSYIYKDKEGKTFSYKDINKYKVKLGLAVTDIGSINTKEGVEKKYTLNKTIIKSYYDSTNDIQKVLDELSSEVKPVEGETKEFTLPTTLRFNADWNFHEKFYLNLNTDIAISGSGKNASKMVNAYTLTPRYESKWFSFYLPMGMYQYSGFQMGAGFRAGPLYIGSGSIVSTLLGDVQAADVYFGLKIPIYQSRPKDSDGDSVLDKVDDCPKEAGAIENDGCPWTDSDKDGVLDKDDKCVDEVGDVDNKGCPWTDSDDDGVLNKDDECPDKKGAKEYKGCPDSDGDGVLDKNDKCLKVSGSVENNGCPEVKKVITKEEKARLDNFARAIYFNSAKTSFQSGVTENLEAIVGIMNKFSDSKFTIEGHTDSQGSDALNLKLSERRAKAVLDYLVKKGISPSRLSSVGFGENYPIASNKTRVGRAENRRVEIKLRK